MSMQEFIPQTETFQGVIQRRLQSEDQLLCNYIWYQTMHCHQCNK